MINKICHQFIKWTCVKNHLQFIHSLNNLEKRQLEILQKITGAKSYEIFKKIYSVTSYDEWRDQVETRRVLEKKITQFIPTSGSTQKIKWIPYDKNFKAELWRATAPWLYDIYKRYPKIKMGTHFWSLSWLPEEMRHDHQTNDLDFFIGLEKFFLKRIMTMPSSVATASTLEESMREAIISLLNNDVTLISIWSPTFLLELLNFLLKEKKYFMTRVNQKIKNVLFYHDKLSPIFVKELFPNLILISSWATSTSSHYANVLTKLFEHAHFEAKGLWATEGVVTIPYEGKFPLAVNSHFYEFIDYETKEIFPSWNLKKGMKVSPLLTTGNGFFRYQLNDLLVVDGFYKEAPCFEFLGRINEVDLVGEKISTELAQNLLNLISSSFSVKAISLMAFVRPHPHYTILIEGQCERELLIKVKDKTEEFLGGSFHYKLARELHQLDECHVLCSENAMDDYLAYCEKQVAIRGNIKLEPLLLVRGS